jgi:hypothetical protein
LEFVRPWVLRNYFLVLSNPITDCGPNKRGPIRSKQMGVLPADLKIFLRGTIVAIFYVAWKNSATNPEIHEIVT